MQKRILYLDLAKLIAIYLVILGHVPYVMVDGMNVGHSMVHFIYSFHMPLFMLLSGFFVSKKMMSLSFLGMIKEKGKQLLIPAITCTAICCIYLFLVRDNVNFRDEIIGNSWFLKTLFVYYVIMYLVGKIPINENILLIAVTILLFVLPGLTTLQINQLWPYFCIGYLLKRNGLFTKIYGSWGVALCFVILYIVCYTLQVTNDIPNYIAINVNSLYSQPHFIILRFLVALSASISVIAICSLIEKYTQESKLYSSISSLGKYTLGVYVLQTSLLVNVFPDIFTLYIADAFVLSAIVAPLLSIVYLIICILTIRFISKSKKLDLLFFGGQYYSK